MKFIKRNQTLAIRIHSGSAWINMKCSKSSIVICSLFCAALRNKSSIYSEVRYISNSFDILLRSFFVKNPFCWVSKREKILQIPSYEVLSLKNILLYSRNYWNVIPSLLLAGVSRLLIIWKILGCKMFAPILSNTSTISLGFTVILFGGRNRLKASFISLISSSESFIAWRPTFPRWP